MQYEDRVSIATPEGVTLEVTLAGLASRTGAALVDSLIQGAAAFVFFLIFIVGTSGGSGPDTTGDPGGGASAFFIGLAFFTLFIFLIFFFYYVVFETLWSGRTPGKKAAGIQVVEIGGGPIGFRASAVRNLVRLVDLLPTSYIIGSIAILASSRNQRLGDMAAGTIVIREQRAEIVPARSTPVVPAAPSTPQTPQVEAPAPVDESMAWDLSGITTEDLATIRRFIERRHSLPVEVARNLAAEIETRLRPKVAGVPEDLRGIEFLERVAAAKAARG